MLFMELLTAGGVSSRVEKWRFGMISECLVRSIQNLDQKKGSRKLWKGQNGRKKVNVNVQDYHRRISSKSNNVLLQILNKVEDEFNSSTLKSESLKLHFIILFNSIEKHMRKSFHVYTHPLLIQTTLYTSCIVPQV